MKKYKIDKSYIIPKITYKDLKLPVLIERKSVYDFLNKVLKMYGNDLKKSKVMDFGCGEAPYYSLFKGAEYVGVDVAVSGHSSDKKNADIYYDEKLPFENDTFMYVVATQCLEHIQNTDSTLAELNRVMKKGGKLIITVPMVWNDHELPYDYYRFTQEGISYKLRTNGFRIVYCNKLNNFEDACGQMKILLSMRKFGNKSKRCKMITIWENLKYYYRYSKHKKYDESLATCLGIIAEKYENA